MTEVFEREVFELLTAHRFLTADYSLSPATLRDPGAPKFLARYVLSQSNATSEEWSSHFPALVNEIVNQIIELEQPNEDAERSRSQYIHILCRRARLLNVGQ
jgi:hypothetical protein